MRVARVIGGVAAAVVGVLMAVGVWMFGGLPTPGDVVAEPVTCAADAPVLPRGRPLKALVWNVQYAGSREFNFFYDGGRQVSVPSDAVDATLAELAAVIRAENPDVVLLQEVDRNSRRTGHVDEHARLLTASGYPCAASAPYHSVAYVPTPSWEHLGRVDMHLSVFSRYRIESATRTQLPLLDEPLWRRLFNLRRALLDVRMPIEGEGWLHVVNTHLSAFSGGDGTLDKQVAVIDALLTQAELAGDAFLFGGDLNALPPGDDASRLGEFAREYPEAVSPATRLFERFSSAIPRELHQADPQRWRTYLPFGATQPDRAIDHVFGSRSVTFGEVRVLSDVLTSDHVPIVVEFTL